MESVYMVFVFLFGLIVGSFLNVVIYRYNTGLGLGGRSRCLSCGRTLGSIDLIPVVSFVLWRGKCRTCRARVSLQYPLVEFLTAFLFTSLYGTFGLSVQSILLAIATSLLIAIAVYDFKHKIIPDGLVYAFILVAIISVFTQVPIQNLFRANLFTDTLAGPFIALPFAFLWLVSGGRWMGFGDAKLALGIGWLLGLSYGISAIILSFWLGAVISLAIILWEKAYRLFFRRTKGLSRGELTLTMKSEIPFAPFLIVSLFIELFFHFDFTHITLFLR